MEYKILERPYTIEEIKEKQDENNFVSGYVSVRPSDMIDNDLEGFLDIIAEKLVNNPCLMNINYTAKGVTEDGAIIFLVSGDVSDILDMEEN